MTIQTIPSKDQTRKTALATRKCAHEKRGHAALALRDHLLASRVLTGAAVISGYCPIRTEIDPTPMMTALSGAGHTICVPVITGADQPLVFHTWTPGCAMTEGAFGAAIPVDGAEVVPTILLVPMLAFDDAGWRLGYGGGFYDRTLEALRRHRRTLAIGVAYDVQRIASVPTEPTDQRLDYILTEHGLGKIRPGEVGQ